MPDGLLVLPVFSGLNGHLSRSYAAIQFLFTLADEGSDKASVKAKASAPTRVCSKAGGSRKRDASPFEAGNQGLAPNRILGGSNVAFTTPADQR